LLYRVCAAIALVVSVCESVHAQPRGERTRLRELKAEFRRLTVRNQTSVVPPGEPLRVLEQILRIDDLAAIQFVVEVSRDSRHQRLQDETLRLLARYAPGSVIVAGLFSEHMSLEDPNRILARGYLIKRAVLRRDDSWLVGLFDRGTLEDRFLAVEALGKIGSTSTLEKANALVRDESWKPIDGTPIGCATIVASVRQLEGPHAARLLLLLRKDPRFTDDDALALREATRLWSRRDLRSYIDLSGLTDPDPDRRAEIALFLGEVGIETARAPLLHLARDAREPVKVRAAATQALGALLIARGDLASTLAKLARDPALEVRRAAIRGLQRLEVRQAAAALVDLLRGPMELDARTALQKLTGLGHDTKWHEWLASPRCHLPEGT
jgi:HEAT repeat protein